MSSGIDGSQLSKIIQNATKDLMKQVESFTNEAQVNISDNPDNSDGTDTDLVYVMLNGSKIGMKKAEYDKMKEMNKVITKKMKEDIKNLIRLSKNTKTSESSNEAIKNQDSF